MRPQTASIPFYFDDDKQLERVASNFDQRLIELQTALPATMKLLKDITLPFNAETVVLHGLGRAPVGVFFSAPRRAGATGIIRDLESKSTLTGMTVDPTKQLLIRADGFANDIVVDILVM